MTMTKTKIMMTSRMRIRITHRRKVLENQPVPGRAMAGKNRSGKKMEGKKMEGKKIAARVSVENLRA
jgi:hypothetical protein